MKGLMSYTAQLILWVAVIAIVLPVITNFYFTISKSDDEICRLSVIEHSALQGATSGTRTTELVCDRKHIRFFDDKVALDGKQIKVKDKDKTVSKFSSLNDDIVNQVLAGELYSCWRRMGKGDLNVFAADAVFGDNVVCLICANVDFQTSKTDTFSGLKHYMDTSYIAKKESEGMTFSQYMNKTYPLYLTLFNQRLPWGQYINFYGDEEPALQIIEPDITTSKSYSIVFSGFKPARFTSWTKSENPAYYVLLIPNDYMTNYCTYIYN